MLDGRQLKRLIFTNLLGGLIVRPECSSTREIIDTGIYRPVTHRHEDFNTLEQLVRILCGTRNHPLETGDC